MDSYVLANSQHHTAQKTNLKRSHRIGGILPPNGGIFEGNPSVGAVCLPIALSFNVEV